MMNENPHMDITIIRPDDWHVHLRDGELLERVARFSASQFSRVLVMPNLDPPITTTGLCLGYRDRILRAVPEEPDFNPKMSLYLTDRTSPREVSDAASCEHVLGFKLYPAGATTHSERGVTRIAAMMPLLEEMAKLGTVLQVHGEVTDRHIDVFDREAMFIDQVLLPLHEEIPDLKIVLEHITTRQGVEFVRSTDGNIAGTITPHHLLYNRNAMFSGGISPHHYCLPVLKREEHRLALLDAATSGNPSFFLGTDSAPHTRRDKETSCGCAGIFSAVSAMEIYTEIFEQADALERLEGFASRFGAQFYQLPYNTGTLTLEKRNRDIPSYLDGSGIDPEDRIVPLRAGEQVSWAVKPKTADRM